MRTLTDKEVDALPRCIHRRTPQRLRYRRAWGEQAGRAAYWRGVPRDANPFIRSPAMPMHEGWNVGWRVAEMAEAEYPSGVPVP